MVGVFKRSLSFPNQIPNRPPKPSLPHHIRSISLPCRSHPLISRLRNGISELRIWSSKSDNRTSSWLCDGLTRLKEVHDSLDDILHLPQTQESLRCQPTWVENLLEDFLRFVDVYGIFQTSVLALKEEQLAAQVATRKRDDSKIASYIKSRKKMAKEMSKLAYTIRDISRCSVPGFDKLSITDAELASVIGDVIEVTASVSVALFNGISLSFASKKSSWMGAMMRLPKRAKKAKMEEGIQELQQVNAESLCGLRKKGDEEVRMVLKRMQDLEGCIGGIGGRGEQVFRSLINTRVSLLNTLTR
ncbi:hypothetical protein P3X46_020696 [Hevea brasiliensis]|uniref:Uncharacterized protein n=2 Tax=Hevea brasiliensis TaxID=3981 RepID=A0ABQ9LH01_HEVBR|nr:uncharacterized protein LOC110654312 [Hevea brasiliensis]KAF2310192.1 hypothetical protein GH714_007136 [Hevea brasiliensis]KAJ9165879.1 hypothetical protein P3X46_020696 [Hevea brasiliensis]